MRMQNAGISKYRLMLAPSSNLKHPLIRYHGGKWRLAERIIDQFPTHYSVYVEPYAGGASVLLRRAATEHEVYNDLDGEIFNLFKVLRNQRDELLAAIRDTAFAEAELSLAFTKTPGLSDVERARRVLVNAFMGRSTAAATQNFSASFRAITLGPREIRNPGKEWCEIEDRLIAVAERLRGVNILNRPALEVIQSLDSPKILFYIDPPYMNGQRDPGKDYLHEMTSEQHRELAELLLNCKGMIALSGYACHEYQTWYEDAGWRRVDFLALADGASSRTESLWLSPNIKQYGLFD